MKVHYPIIHAFGNYYYSNQILKKTISINQFILKKFQEDQPREKIKGIKSLQNCGYLKCKHCDVPIINHYWEDKEEIFCPLHKKGKHFYFIDFESVFNFNDST